MDPEVNSKDERQWHECRTIFDCSEAKGKQGQQKHRLNRNKGIWGCSPRNNSKEKERYDYELQRRKIRLQSTK